ncbi:cellulase [Sistotremastrum niveocremeum HHB9708]|uniref:cellulase n=2 Tax=Sistotremastraceae TaxID=3402574 RepID=A0A164UMI4_9AGAM|nr:cellulase [Sistotremastrum niveocremeum HHB9708]KZT43827.1 cellulase [Sistotremastrum suecicum HHB10207 ss-3]
MKTTLFLAAALAAAPAFAQVQEWGQCGGIQWTGQTSCASGLVCTELNPYYYQCLPPSSTSTTTSSTTKSTTTTTSSSTKSTTTTTTTTTTSSTTKSTTTTTSSTTTSSTSTGSSTPTPCVGRVKFAGVNIAGFDFGCDTNGNCNVTQAYPPITQTYGPDGIGQMKHFVTDDGFNMFRLPVGWQYLTNGVAAGPLYQPLFSNYDILVQGCLATGAYCIIDIHNYARFNGAIVGQGGPPSSALASVWGDLAAYYANQPRIVFGTMNEPHDVPSITTWAQTVQAVVTAIRQAGATSQMILLPGNDWTSAAAYISDGSAAALGAVTNPDGSTTNLIFEVHKYSDSDNSGTHTNCVTNNIADAFQPLATYARANNRLVLNTEFGGGNGTDCITDIGQQLAFLNANSDVFLGWTGWSAGSFDATYNLGLTPVNHGGVWTDTPLVASALIPAFQGVPTPSCSATWTTTSTSTTTTTTSTSKSTTTTTTSSTTTTTSSTTKTTTTTTTSKTGTPTISGNPFVGKTALPNPYYTAEIQAAIPLITDAHTAAAAAVVENIPTFFWLDTVSKVSTLQSILAAAAASGSNNLVEIVVYDLPNRDCHAKASNGEFTIANNGVANYENYIDQIVSVIAQYPTVSVVAVIEPDSLANLVTNLSDPNCSAAQTAYKTCIVYAIQRLSTVGVAMYLDAGHAGWLGWPANLQPAATLFGQIYQSAGSPNTVRGLATNVANYNSYTTNSPDPCTQGDPNYDELLYITALAPLLSSSGFPAHFIVDQGRSGQQNLRQQWGDWCNIKGAGFGIRPTTVTNSSYVDSIVWVKPGGECDGTSNSSAPRYDSTCSLSDADQPAPQAGQWFQEYFVTLVAKANPPLI